LDSESLLLTASALTFLEALYLIIANPRRIEQVLAGVCLWFAALIFIAINGKMHPESLVGGIADWLFALSASFLPFTWLLLTTWWGRDVAGERKVSTQSIGLFACFVGSLVFTVGLGAEPALTFTATEATGSYFEISTGSLPLPLFVLVSILFGLYNIESTIRSAVGSQRQKLSFGFAVLLIVSGFALFIGSVEVILEKISLWSILACAALLPIAGLSFTLSLRQYDPSTLGVVVTRRLKRTSVVIVTGGAFIILLGIVDELVERFGTLPEVTIPALSVVLVAIFFVSVFALDLAQGRAIKDKPLEPSANAQVLRDFVEDVSISTSIDEIVSRIGLLLEHDHSISQCALLEPAGNDSYVLLSPKQEQRTIPRGKVTPIAEWMHRHGLPIAFEDFCERSPISEENSRFWKTAFGFTPMVLVPFISRRRLVGILITGPAKDGHTDFRELLDFMEVVAPPLSMAIQNSRVTDELVSAKELESYYRVASFVNDDIKRSIELLERVQTASGAKTELPPQKTISEEISRLRRVASKLALAPADQWTISEMDINRLITEVLDSIQIRSRERIILQEKFAASLKIKADRQQLFAIFDNILSNAVEAMPDGGTLTISTEEFFDLADNQSVKITIADTGVGMSPDFVESKLFRPFAVARKEGLGIGLFQAREVIRQLGGSLTVESAPTEGTRVYITLRT
jgi:Histidine kinase-, DNA gyrase B-, and HSP90-like ATPase